MAETEGLKVKISADASEYTEETTKMVRQTYDIAGTINRIVAGIGIIALLRRSTNAFAQAEKAAFAFQSAMEQMKVPQQTIDNLREFSRNLERMYGITEVETQNAIAILTRLVGSGGAVDRLKEALANMAVATGQSMTSVANIIARTINTGLTGLQRYGIVATDEQKKIWDELGDDMEARADFIAELLNDRFGGALDAYGNTAVAANERAKQAFERTMTTLGNQVLPIFTGLLTIIDRITNAFGGLAVTLGILAAVWLATSIIKRAIMISEGQTVDGLILKYLALGLANLWATNPILAATAGLAFLALIAGVVYGLSRAAAAIGGGSVGGSLNPDTSTVNDNNQEKETEEPPIINNIVINQDNMGDYNARTDNINGTKTNVRTR